MEAQGFHLRSQQQLELWWLCKYQLRRGFAAAHLILLTQLSKSELLLPTLLLLPLPLLLKPLLLLPTLLLLPLPLLLKPLRLLLLLTATAAAATAAAATAATLGLGPGVSGLGPGVSGLAPQTTSGCPAPAARFARRTHFGNQTLKKKSWFVESKMTSKP